MKGIDKFEYLYSIVEREHPITIRGVMYRAASTENPWFTDTSDDTYKDIDQCLVDMRMSSGKVMENIPFEWISDETRIFDDSLGFNDPDEYMRQAANEYIRNHWEDQPKHVEVFTEKVAMGTILRPITRKWNVPFLMFRGFCSLTALWKRAQAWEQISPDRQILVLYLGDWDRHGFHIENDAERRLKQLSNRRFKWDRIAITKDQYKTMKDQYGINQYYKKTKDWFTKVEVDAMHTSEIRELLESEIVANIDMDLWEKSATKEKQEQTRLMETYLD